MSLSIKESVRILAEADLNDYWVKSDLSLEKKSFIRWFCKPKAGELEVALEKIQNEINSNEALKNDEEFVRNFFKFEGKVRVKLIKGERCLKDEGVRNSISELAQKVSTTLSFGPLVSFRYQEKLQKEMSFIEEIEQTLGLFLSEEQKKVIEHAKLKHQQGKLCGIMKPKYYHATEKENVEGILDLGIECRKEGKRKGAWVSTKPLTDPSKESCYGNAAFALNDSIEQYDTRPDLDLENDVNSFRVGEHTYKVISSRLGRSFGLWVGFHSSIPVKLSKELKREDRIAYYQSKPLSFVIVPNNGSEKLQKDLAERNILFLTDSQFKGLSLSQETLVLPDSWNTSDRWATDDDQKNYGEKYPLSSMAAAQKGSYSDYLDSLRADKHPENILVL